MSHQKLLQQHKEQKFTAAYIKSVLHYDPITGHFFWAKDKGRMKQGTRAGKQRPSGHISIKIDACEFMGHRLAWLIQTGEWPVHHVDHIDRVKSNNAWTNLREATQMQNVWNSITKRGSLQGVSALTNNIGQPTGLFRARIRRNGKSYNLGLYDSPVKAHAAYKAAVTQLSQGFDPK